MSEQFKVGDVCVAHSFIMDVEKNGLECVLVAYDGMRGTLRARGVHGKWWKVQWPDGRMTYVREVNLRLKRPPRRDIDTVVRWEDCAWSPFTVKLDKAIERAKEAA